MKVKEESEKVVLKLNIQKTKIMASGPITLWQIDRETVETVADFIFLGSKITADGDCSHETKRRLLLGRNVMTNLDSVNNSAFLQTSWELLKTEYVNPLNIFLQVVIWELLSKPSPDLLPMFPPRLYMHTRRQKLNRLIFPFPPGLCLMLVSSGIHFQNLNSWIRVYKIKETNENQGMSGLKLRC